MKVIDIWINCPNREIAEAISEKLVNDRIAACSNLFQEINSCYHWQGEIETTTEIPLLVKTRESLFNSVCKIVSAMHPYETPCILGMPIEFINDDYRNWVYAETENAII